MKKHSGTPLKQQFPKVILSAPVVERITYFKNEARIKHPALNKAFDDALACISSVSGARIIIIAGPTGVGKTTMAEGLARELRRRFAAQMLAEPDFIPVMYGNAVPPSGRSFDWKDFYIRMLLRSGEVLVDRKLLLSAQRELYPELQLQASLDGQASAPLRRAAENCLRHRRTRILIIDEAHHMLMMNKLDVQFENLKSLATETGTTIVLVGTYRLLEIRDQSAQLVRRSKIVHFPRYDSRIKLEQAAFYSALGALQSHLPLRVMPNLLEHAEYFYDKTGGCVGILKDWLTRSLELALNTDRSFGQKLVAECALSNKEMMTILGEIFEGEAKLSDISDEEVSFYVLNGLTIKEDVAARRSTVRNTSPAGKGNIHAARRVGQRKASRDPVGGAHVG